MTLWACYIGLVFFLKVLHEEGTEGGGGTSPMSPTTNDAILFLHFLFPAV